MRLIDADAFDERIRAAGGMAEEELTEDFKDGVLTTLEMLKRQPSAIARPHGRLIDAEEMLEADRWGFERAQASSALSDIEKDGLKLLHDALKDFIEERPTIIEAEEENE